MNHVTRYVIEVQTSREVDPAVLTGALDRATLGIAEELHGVMDENDRWLIYVAPEGDDGDPFASYGNEG